MVKPGYKQTEVGVIPEDWEVVRLGSISRSFSGGTPSTAEPRYYGGDVPWITSGDLNRVRVQHVNGRITTLGLRSSSAKMVGAGTVLIAMYGATAGVVAKTEIDAAINQAILAVLPTARCTQDFLFFALRARAPHYVETHTQGGQPNLSGALVRDFILALPPSTAEQQAIAEALSDADALIESLEALIAKKRQIKQGAMQELLTGKRRLSGFSGEWEMKRLGDVSEIRIGRTPSRGQPRLWGGRNVWLSIADLVGRVVSDSKEKISDEAAAQMTEVAVGTLLMSFKLSIGRVAFAGTALYTNEAICALAGLVGDARYVYYSLTRVDFSLYGKQAVKGYTLNKASLAEVLLPMPDVAEQVAIAEVLWAMDTELEALEAKLGKARAIKQGMMQELLTGRTRLVSAEAS